MRNWIFLFVLVSVCGLFFLGCGPGGGNIEAQETAGEETEVGGGEDVTLGELDCSDYPFESKICGWVAAGNVVHCTFTKDGKSSEMWLKAGNPKLPNNNIKMMGKILTDKGLVNIITHMNKETMKIVSYTWKDGASSGVKMEVDLSGVDVPENARVKSYEDDAVSIQCEKADIGADILNPPGNVNFMDMREVMQNPALAKQILG